VLQRAAELTDRDLDRAGISILELGGGRSLPPVRRVFGPNGFDVPLWMLIDEDVAVPTANDLGVEVSELAAAQAYVSMQDLEDEYVAAIGADECMRRLKASKEFKKNQLNLCEKNGPDGTYTDDDVAAFCRRNSDFKVRAALVIAATLTEDEAREISSVEALLVSLSV
jgi:putative ATP-dependent endonuclease of OLD family